MADEGERGPGAEKLWAGSLLVERAVEFMMRLEREQLEVHPYEILGFLSSIGVGQAESDALTRMVVSWETQPYYEFVRRDHRDGKLHRYRISWRMDNKAVRNLFARVVFDELRKLKLKSDSVTQLAIALGRYRGKGAEGAKPRGRPKTL